MITLKRKNRVTFTEADIHHIFNPISADPCNSVAVAAEHIGRKPLTTLQNAYIYVEQLYQSPGNHLLQHGIILFEMKVSLVRGAKEISDMDIFLNEVSKAYGNQYHISTVKKDSYDSIKLSVDLATVMTPFVENNASKVFKHCLLHQYALFQKNQIFKGVADAKYPNGVNISIINGENVERELTPKELLEHFYVSIYYQTDANFVKEILYHSNAALATSNPQQHAYECVLPANYNQYTLMQKRQFKKLCQLGCDIYHSFDSSKGTAMDARKCLTKWHRYDAAFTINLKDLATFMRNCKAATYTLDSTSTYLLTETLKKVVIYLSAITSLTAEDVEILMFGTTVPHKDKKRLQK